MYTSVQIAQILFAVLESLKVPSRIQHRPEFRLLYVAESNNGTYCCIELNAETSL